MKKAAEWDRNPKRAAKATLPVAKNSIPSPVSTAKTKLSPISFASADRAACLLSSSRFGFYLFHPLSEQFFMAFRHWMVVTPSEIVQHALHADAFSSSSLRVLVILCRSRTASSTLSRHCGCAAVGSAEHRRKATEAY
jgi:hypothetical protein